MTILKKLFLIIILTTTIWYFSINQYYRNQSLGWATICLCPPVNAETYQGLNWPKIFFVNEGCGDCGLPEPPAQFFNHLFILSIPTVLILLGLSVYKYIQKIRKYRTKQMYD